MGRRGRTVCATACTILLAACATLPRGPSFFGPGAKPYQEIFDPSRFFAGELKGIDDVLVLTVASNARDDYIPDYSLAVAHRCVPLPDGKSCEHAYVVRMLRAGGDAKTFDEDISLFGRANRTRSLSALHDVLDASSLPWLETDLYGCKGAVEAFDNVRKADWNPDLHYGMLAPEDRDLILHPAQITVRMSGDYSTSTYRGWVLADGAPAAIRQLLQVLEPCWAPSKAPRPWNR